MDWIQWYLAIMLAIKLIAGMIVHGHERDGRWDFRVEFFGTLCALPYIGRVFGWW